MVKDYDDIRVGDKFICLTKSWNYFGYGSTYKIISKQDGVPYTKNDIGEEQPIYDWDLDLMRWTTTSYDITSPHAFTRDNFIAWIEYLDNQEYYSLAMDADNIRIKFEQFLDSRKPVDKDVQDAIELLKSKGYTIDKSN